ncbi:MAG: hypothetical protein IPK34_03285 [Ramlibacter sp.]|nr:hypothetical protein [Ramlibacter sp.]
MTRLWRLRGIFMTKSASSPYQLDLIRYEFDSERRRGMAGRCIISIIQLLLNYGNPTP